MRTESENRTSFFRFEDLRIYGKALDYAKWLDGVIETIPSDVRQSTGLGFLKSAQSIALNIACLLYTNKSQFIYYLKMAKSAVRECVVYTAMLNNVGVLNEELNEYSRNSLMELTKMIGSLIASLQRSSSQAHKGEDE